MQRLLVLFTMLVSTTAVAGTPLFPLIWAGELHEAAGPVNRNVSAVFVVKDGVTTVSQVEDASFDVTEGNVIVDLLVNDAPGLTVEVIINGEALGSMPLTTTWPAAAFADSADSADVADSADAVGAITQPVTKAMLATAGQASIPVSSINGFPEAFLDGDQGLDFVPDSVNFSFVNGVLSLKNGTVTAAQVTNLLGADLAPGAVTNAKIANNTLVAADLGTLPLTKIAPDAIGARHIGTAAQRTPMFRVTQTGCRQAIGTITLSSTCDFVNTGTCQLVGGQFPINGRVSCTGQCVTGTTSPCANTLFGALVFK